MMSVASFATVLKFREHRDLACAESAVALVDVSPLRLPLPGREGRRAAASKSVAGGGKESLDEQVDGCGGAGHDAGAGRVRQEQGRCLVVGPDEDVGQRQVAVVVVVQ